MDTSIMKIGVLATGWNCSEYFDQVLEPWLEYKRKNDNLIISAVSTQFKGNESEGTDDSRELMKGAFNTKKIDYLAIPTGMFEESDARNLALTPLLQNKVDYIILLDFDEIYTVDEITKIFKFVENNPFTTWFSIHFKNYVIDKKHYVEDFCPPRIFRVQLNLFKLKEFYFDNDINYENENVISSYKTFPSMTIPKQIAFVKHYSWCGTPERLKRKIDYQLKHFNGICSYKWDEEKNKLELNMDFYKKYHVPAPPIIYET